MLARTQQLIIFIWVVATLGWLAYFMAHGRPLLAVVGALLIGSGHALVLAVEFAMLRSINRDDPAPPASAHHLFRAWWGEVCAATLVFCWRQPYRSQVELDHLPADAQGRRGVLLVHGFVCNRGLWNPWMGKLRAAGVPFVAINLEPVLGSIDRYAPLIDKGVRQLEAATGVPPLIAAHSMGGLAVRAWLDSHGGDTRVHGVVTVGSPHRGTWMARFAFARNAREMQRGGDWIETLARREPASRYERFTCFYSHCDNIVLPASTATLPGARNLHVPGVAHVQMLFHAEVFNEVMARLR